MLRRGTEYLEDQLLAKQLAKEDEQARAQLNKKPLQKLQLAVDDAYVLWLTAQDSNISMDALQKLEQTYQQAKKTLETEEIKFGTRKPPLNSIAVIQASLKASADSKDSKASPSAAPVRLFTPDEIKLINEHYRKIPDQLQKLMDAAMGEDITLELVTDPVFIRREGHVYDRKTAIDFLKGKPEAMCPHNQEINYKKTDIIPCNALIEAMGHLLSIANGASVPAQPVNNKLAITNESRSLKRSRIQADVVALIEKNYSVLPEKHKLLFNTICRDSVTNQIIDDPVLLPDGYIYDRSTAEVYLKLGGGICPKNNSIIFTKEDITPCVTVCKVLDQLRDNIQNAMKMLEKANADAKKTETIKPKV
jgi:hypothetical protein